MFGEAVFLLLGTGVGYSVQKHHVEVQEITRPNMNRTRRFLVNDSIEGWADAVKALVNSYLEARAFVLTKICPRCCSRTSGGKAQDRNRFANVWLN